MNILWVCNIPLPIIAEKINIPTSTSGGWLAGLSSVLRQTEGISLSVCFPYNGASFSGEAAGIRYASFPTEGYVTYSKKTEKNLCDLFNTFSPDVIHVFGTESAHSLAAVRAAEKCGLLDKTVVSIQGLVSVIGKYHYTAGLSARVCRKRTLRDILKRDNINQQQKKFQKRGVLESTLLRTAKHVIGRTVWDKACIKQINPTLTYHFCNETLRESFYQNAWTYEACEKHSIFFSQCTYPLKGFHNMLDALAILKKKYPDVHLYTAGPDVTTNDRPLLRQKKTYYWNYLTKKIRKMGLTAHVTFLGGLDETQMCGAYLRANVFASASSIENSPNSVGEAMLLGVPTVASDVGGVTSMLTHGKDGFVYPSDEPYMLAHYIGEIFDDPDLAQTLSESARIHAGETHNAQKNNEALLSVYRTLAQA